ncbi:MAG TPA: choice-of-anchor D domain-containing protein [Rubricoccaceae bacterium]
MPLPATLLRTSPWTTPQLWAASAGLLVALLAALPAAAQPRLAVSQPALTQALGAGATATQTLTVTNTGNAALTFAAARGPAGAPAGGPDAYGYTWTDSDRTGGPVYQWTDIRATGTRHTLTSSGGVWVDLPFAFPFYGQTYTRVKVYADGLISFLPTYQGSTSNNRPVPYWDNPDLFIAGFWDDLDPSRAGGVYTGTDARGRFVVQYHEVGLAGSTAPDARYTFQIVLDPSGTALVQYGPMVGPTNSATVGIENATSDHGGSTTGLEVAYNEPYVRNGLAVRIARGDPWLSVVGGGTLAPGASAGVTATFSSFDLQAGTYASALALTSNSAPPTVVVPATLTVLSVPDVAVSATSVAFGDVFIGGTGADTLVVTNAGSAPLTLSSVTAGGSPFFTASVGPTVMAPGAIRRIAVRFEPALVGPSTGTLVLTTDDPDEPAVSVTLAGLGVPAPDVAVTPPALTASVAAGLSVTHTLTVANTGGAALTFALSLRPDGAGSALDSLYSDSGAAGAGTTGWTPWRPFAVSNRFTATDRFSMTAVRAFLKIERDPTVRVEVYGAGTFGDPTSGPLLRSLDVSIPHGPAAMHEIPLDTTLVFERGEDFYVVIWTEGEYAPFGVHTNSGGRSYRRTFHSPTWYHETGSTTYVIRALRTTGDWIGAERLTGTVPAGGSVDVPVRVGGAALIGGQYTGSVVVESDDPDEPEVVVPVTLGVTGVPEVAVSADTLDFAEVFLGAAVSRTVTVRNVGTGPLTVSAVTSSAPAFSVSPAGAFTLGVDQSRAVEVTFTPVVSGLVAASLTVTSDDPGRPVATVALTGEGALAPNLAVAPDSLAAVLDAGMTGTATLAVSNTGAGPLEFTFPGYTEALRSWPHQERRASDPSAAPVWLGKGALDARRGNVAFDSGGPDAFGYSWSDSNEPGGPAFSWADISETGTALPLGDDDSETVSLPFPFTFYGQPYTDVVVSSNGFLTFAAAGATAFTNQPVPRTATPSDLIAPFWDDLNPGSGGTVYAGADSLGRFVVQWDDVVRYGTSDRYTFQAILTPNGSVLFQYLEMQGPLLDQATVGIENAAGDDGLEVAFNAPYVHDGLAVRIGRTPPWLTSVSPSAGTVAPGTTAQVTVTFDASVLEAGLFRDALLLQTNDPDTPALGVPVRLEVAGDLLVRLGAGWNLVSWNVATLDTTPEAVLAPVLDRVLAVESYRGGERLTWAPGRTTNTLSALDPMYSYWVRLAAPGTLALRGERIAAQTPLALSAGPNAVSYLPARANGIGYALEDVLGAAVVASAFPGTGLTFSSAVPDAFQVLAQMEPKAGYVLHLAEPATLVYPAATGGMGAGSDAARPTLEGRLRAEREAGVTATPEWVSVWGAGLTGADGHPLPVGVRVTAVDPQGTVCGAFDVVADGHLGLMAVYADDPATPEDEGAAPGERVTLRFAGDAATVSFTWTAFGDIVDLSGTVVAGEDEPGALPNAFSLDGNAPNPFGTRTTVRFALPVTTRVRLVVYDLLGREVSTLVDGELHAGRHSVVWDATGAASGAYVVVMEAEDFRATRRLTLVR